jgi:hypothetical protein
VAFCCAAAAAADLHHQLQLIMRPSVGAQWAALACLLCWVCMLLLAHVTGLQNPLRGVAWAAIAHNVLPSQDLQSNSHGAIFHRQNDNSPLSAAVLAEANQQTGSTVPDTISRAVEIVQKQQFPFVDFNPAVSE